MQVPSNIAVIGASGALGRAFTTQLQTRYPQAAVHACARTELPFTPGARTYYHHLDVTDEATVARAAESAASHGPFDLILVTTGILHEPGIMPEKALRDLDVTNLQRLFAINTVGPALVAKHFFPNIHRKQRSVCAALSARVGSISDNRIGGWYGYRASKAALNMIIKNAAIELGRRHKEAVIVGMHPGTVDSQLSEPFQAHVPSGKLFSPEYAAESLLEVLAELTPEQSGRCFAWDGQEVMP